MKTRTAPAILVLAALLGSACPVRAQTVSLSLQPTNALSSPGGTVTFQATITNHSALPVFLTADNFEVADPGVALDDAKFETNFILPGPLAPGESRVAEAFDLTVDETAPVGTYGGNFTVMGGEDEDWFEDLALAEFEVGVTPEGDSRPLMLAALLSLLVGGARPRLRQGCGLVRIVSTGMEKTFRQTLRALKSAGGRSGIGVLALAAFALVESVTRSTAGRAKRPSFWQVRSPTAILVFLLAFLGAAAVRAAGVWTAIAPIPVARHAQSAVTGLDGRIYLIGGTIAGPNTHLPDLDAYDPATGVWTSLAPMPTPRGYFAAATGADGRIYVFGGVVDPGGAVTTDVTECYDPSTNSWSTLAPMPEANTYLAVGRGLDDRIYMLGSRASSIVQIYHPSTNSWSTGAAIPNPRNVMSGTTGLDGRLYVFGGHTAATQHLASADVYDPDTDTWSSIAPMPSARALMGVTLGADGRLYLLGGNANGTLGEATCFAYDSAANTWSAVEAMLTGRSSFGAATSPDGRIYALGGQNPGGMLSVSEVYGVTPNSLTALRVFDIKRNSARVEWTTDLLSSSLVEHGLPPGYGASATGPGGTAHLVTVTGLTAGLLRHFRAVSNGLASPNGVFITAPTRSRPGLGLALTRQGSPSNLTLNVTVFNQGPGAINNVRLTSGKARVGGTTVSLGGLPQNLGSIAADGCANASPALAFPGTLGGTGTFATLTLKGTYAGRKLGGTWRVRLP